LQETAASVSPACRCGEMADAQDLKSWGRKKPCGFESHHRHQIDKMPVFIDFL
jgi:hypothetical protein